MIKFNFTTLPSLKTKRLVLRQAHKKDTKVVFELRSSEEINKFVKTKRVETLDEAEDFINISNHLFKEKKRIFWLIEFENNIIGSIVLHKILLEKNYAEIGYKLKPEFQQKGFMSEALQEVLKFSFTEINLKMIEAFTHKNNMASIALLKRNHFIFQPERRDKNIENNRIWKLENL